MKRSHISIALTILLLATMDYQLTGRVLHRYTGGLLFFLMLLHLRVNHSWLTGLLKGHWPLSGMVSFLVNLGLFLSCIGAVLSGLLILPYALAHMDRIPHIHQFHYFCAYLMLILSGIHLGLHWAAIWPRMRRALHFRPGVQHAFFRGILLFMIVLGGIYASFQYQVGDRLLMVRLPGLLKTHQAFPYLFAHTTLFGMYTIMGCYLHRFLHRTNK